MSKSYNFNKPDCVCFECVKYKAETGKNIDCACESSPDRYIEERCENCKVNKYCDIYNNPEDYK